jgi:hypothetical protein
MGAVFFIEKIKFYHHEHLYNIFLPFCFQHLILSTSL